MRTIHDIFGIADILQDENHKDRFGTARRDLADSYISTLDLTDPRDVQKLLIVLQDAISNQLANLGRDPQNTYAIKEIALFTNTLKVDGFVIEDGIIVARNSSVGLSKLTVIAEAINAEYIRNQVKRMEQSVESDPAAAIGASKDLIETCCKTILTDLGIAGVDDMDVPKLVKETSKALKLTPEDVPETSRGKDAMRRLLGSLATMATSLAELRNEYGTGHGKHGMTKAPKPRHARLAVTSAAAFASFMMETHQMKQEKSGK